MRAVQRLGWVMLGALPLVALPAVGHAQAKSKKAAAAAESGADVGDLERRVRTIEQKLDQQQKGNTAEHGTMKQRVEAIEKEVKDTKDTIAEKLGVDFHGFVATNYNYNFNSPDSRTNRLHVFDEDANTFALDQANINIQRNQPEGLGFNLDLDFGKAAEVVGRFTRWSGGSGGGESSNSVELRQAYLKYTIPDTDFSLQAGKFVTFHGAEIIKSYNNFNYNISSGILFGNSIPFTHTGVLGSYAFGDLGSVSAGIINGWDNVSDNNDGKSLHAMLTLVPDPMFTFVLSGTYGPEQNDNGRSKRLMITPLITVKPIDQLTFIVDYNYGNESNVQLDAATASLIDAPGNAMWQGVAGYVVFAATDEVQVAVRGELFDDPDGVRTLFEEPGFGPGATFWEVTPTLAIKLTEGLLWRLEYRHDESDKRFFDKDERTFTQRGQDLIGTELIYAF
jgi:hypothetical protein